MVTEENSIQMRNHITYVIEKMWVVFLLVLAVLLGDEDSILLGIELLKKGNIVQGLLVIGGAVVILLIVCLWYVNRWYRTTFTIKDGTIIYDRATLKHYVNTISIANVSNVNLEQNIFEMIVGTYKVKVDTNSLSTADETDIEIILKKKDALWVKQEILSKMNELQKDAEGKGESEEAPVQQNGMVQQEAEEKTFDIVYSVKQVLQNTLLSISIVQVLAVLALCVFSVIMAIGSFVEGKGLMLSTISVISAVALVIFYLLALLKPALRDYQFRARRERDKIYVKSGLFTKNEYVIPIAKINAVSLEYSFIGRVFKRGFVKVINIGGEGEEAGGVKILLTDSYEELTRKMQILLPEYALPEMKQLKRQPLKAFVLKMLRNVFYIICLVAGFLGAMLVIESHGKQQESIAGMINEIFSKREQFAMGIILLVILAIITLISLLTYCTVGLYQSQEKIVLARGTFARRIMSISYDKVQYITKNQGPVARKLGLCRGSLSLLAGALNQIQAIGCYNIDVFNRMEENFYQNYHREEDEKQ